MYPKIANELPFENMLDHSTHSTHLTRVQEYETQYRILDMLLVASDDGDRIDLFLPTAMPLDARVFRHNRQHTAESGGAVAHLAAFLPIASALSLPTLIRQSVVAV